MNKWIRAGGSMLVVAAVVLITGFFVPLSVEDDVLGTIDCGSAFSVDADVEEIGCGEAATDRRTLIYLVSGAIGGFGLILLGFGQPQTPSRRDPHPFLVRPAGVDESDELWSESVEQWRASVHRTSGNRVEVLEVGAGEVAALLISRRQVWRDIRRDGLVVQGPSLAELEGGSSG